MTFSSYSQCSIVLFTQYDSSLNIALLRIILLLLLPAIVTYYLDTIIVYLMDSAGKGMAQIETRTLTVYLTQSVHAAPWIIIGSLPKWFVRDNTEVHHSKRS